MIRAGAHDTDTGRKVIILGLSDENWRRLRELDEPIRFDAAELGFAGEVVIIAGATEEEMESDLRAYGLLRPDTPHRRDPDVHPFHGERT